VGVESWSDGYFLRAVFFEAFLVEAFDDGDVLTFPFVAGMDLPAGPSPAHY
jgi:hypothetical protein